MTTQILTPVLAFAGTLIVALLGFYQWRRQNGDLNRASNAAAKRAAYEGLWQKLEEMDLELRSAIERQPSIDDHVRSINQFFISKSLYFDDDDKKTIDSYVGAMHRVRSAVEEMGDAAIKRSYSLTEDIPHVPHLMTALEEMQKYRVALKKKVIRVCGTT